MSNVEYRVVWTGSDLRPHRMVMVGLGFVPAHIRRAGRTTIVEWLDRRIGPMYGRPRGPLLAGLVDLRQRLIGNRRLAPDRADLERAYPTAHPGETHPKRR